MLALVVSCRSAEPGADDSAGANKTGGTAQSAKSSSNPPAPSASPSSSPRVIRAATATDLGPPTVEIVERYTGDPDSGQSTGLRAVGPDGTFVFTTSRPEISERLHQDSLVVSSSPDPSAGTTMTTPKTGSAAQQFTGAAVTDRYVVWQETPSTSIMSASWEMYALDRATGETWVVTKSRSIDGHPPPPPPGFTAPVVVGDRVYWVQPRKGRRRFAADIVGCRISDCRPTVVTRSAAFPSAGSRGLYVIHGEGFDGKHLHHKTLRLSVVNLRSGREETIRTVPAGRRVSIGGFAVSGDRAIWINDRRRADTVDIIDLRTGRATVTVRGKPSRHFPPLYGYPIITPRYAAWAEGSGTAPQEIGGYVLDLKTRKLYTVGNRSGLYDIQGYGDYLMWQEVHRKKAQQVLARFR